MQKATARPAETSSEAVCETITTDDSKKRCAVDQSNLKTLMGIASVAWLTGAATGIEELAAAGLVGMTLTLYRRMSAG